MRSRPFAVALGVAAVMLAVTGCADDEPLATPVTPSVAPTAASTPVEPSPTPVPSPSPTPLSPFENDPAVQALRANLAAAAVGINTGNLRTPELVATSTARRLELLPDIYASELGTHFPGPRPVAVLGVNVVSETSRSILACSLEEGHGLDKAGGTPTQAEKVLPLQFEVLLEGTAWKVNRATAAEGVSCAGVPLPRTTA